MRCISSSTKERQFHQNLGACQAFEYILRSCLTLAYIALASEKRISSVSSLAILDQNECYIKALDLLDIALVNSSELAIAKAKQTSFLILCQLTWLCVQSACVVSGKWC